MLFVMSIGITGVSFKYTPFTDKFCGSYTSHAPLVLSNIHGTPTSPVVYIGNWYQPTGNTPCVSINNCSYLLFVNNLVGGTTYYGTSETGFNITNSQYITVRNNYVEKVAGGVYAQACKSIKADSNQFKNMMGSVSSGPRGQFVQFNNVTGPGSSISYNRGLNIQGQSASEDLLNCYKTQGTATSPVRVIGNLMRGGYSLTGAAITVGDGGSGVACQYIVIAYNITVQPGADGYQVAGGQHIQVYNNKCYSSATTISHCGLNVGNYSGGTMSDITFSNNQVRWYSGRTKDVGHANDSVRFTKHITPGLPIPTGWSTNIDATFGPEILPTHIITTCTPIH